MTTEKTEDLVVDPNAEKQIEGTQTEQEVEYSPVQLKAIEQGWIPKEEFDGDPEEFIDAAEFVRRGELFSKINSSSKEIKQLKDALNALKHHNSKIKEVEYERALKAVKSEIRKARIEGDHEREFALEDRKDELELEKKAVVNSTPDEPTGPSEEFISWVGENPWYETNEVMRDAADAIGRRLHTQGKTNTEIFKAVTAKIKQEFSDKFRIPNTKKAPSVEGSSRNSGKSSGDVTMTEQDRDMMKKIVRTGVMTEAEYKAQFKVIKDR